MNKKPVLKKIKLVISDVDGVLTDGGMYYSASGEHLKKFNTRDGMAVELLHSKGINVVFLTREKSDIVKARAKKLKIDAVYLGIKTKELILEKICKKFDVKKDQIAYVGDDINDLKIMQLVGFSACPKNGMDIIKKNSDYVCTLDGGDGVLREITEIILKNK